MPHYFDRLTPISLAIIKGDEPKFDDLVGSKATLPANKEYVSPPYRNLKWLAGKRDIEFYVLKGEDEVRYWNVHLEEPPKRDVTVELRLRQIPGQSWAKLSLSTIRVQLHWVHLLLEARFESEPHHRTNFDCRWSKQEQSIFGSSSVSWKPGTNLLGLRALALTEHP